MSEITAAYLDEIFDAFNRQDVDAIRGFFAEDGVFQTPLGPPPFGHQVVGPRAIGEFLKQRWKQMPDLRWQAQKSWIVGNRAFTEWTVLGTTPAGEPFRWAGCDLYEFEGRKIMRKDTYWKGPGGRM